MTSCIGPVLQPNSERFQQGSRTVLVFWGVRFRVTNPRPQRLKPNRFAVGNYISRLRLHIQSYTTHQILNYTSRLALPITSCISHLHPRKAQINAHFRKTCFLSGFSPTERNFHCAFSSENSDGIFLGHENKYMGEKHKYPSIRTQIRFFSGK